MHKTLTLIDLISPEECTHVQQEAQYQYSLATQTSRLVYWIIAPLEKVTSVADRARSPRHSCCCRAC